MRPISLCKNVSECLNALWEISESDVECGRHLLLADRINDLTRWIPVSERMPTEEDGDERGNVLWWSLIGEGGAVIWEWDTPPEYHGKIVRTHWQRITPPEGA